MIAILLVSAVAAKIVLDKNMMLSLVDGVVKPFFTVDPNDRSMPPVMITMVEPMATIDRIDTCSAMLRKFCGSRKLGVVTVTIRVIMRRASSGPKNS